MFFKVGVLKNFAISTVKYLWCLLKRESNTGVFLRILQNFQEHLFWRTSITAAFVLVTEDKVNWSYCKHVFYVSSDI